MTWLLSSTLSVVSSAALMATRFVLRSGSKDVDAVAQQSLTANESVDKTEADKKFISRTVTDLLGNWAKKTEVEEKDVKTVFDELIDHAVMTAEAETKKGMETLFDGFISDAVTKVETRKKERGVADLIVTPGSLDESRQRIEKLTLKAGDEIKTFGSDLQKVEVESKSGRTLKNAETFVKTVFATTCPCDLELKLFTKFLINCGLGFVLRWLYAKDASFIMRLDWYQTKEAYLKALKSNNNVEETTNALIHSVDMSESLRHEFLTLAESNTDLYSKFVQNSTLDLKSEVADFVMLGNFDNTHTIEKTLADSFQAVGLATPDSEIRSLVLDKLSDNQKEKLKKATVSNLCTGFTGLVWKVDLVNGLRNECPFLTEAEAISCINETIQNDPNLQQKLDEGVKAVLLKKALFQSMVYQEELTEAYKKSCQTIGIKGSELLLNDQLKEKLAKGIAETVYGKAIKTGVVNAEEVKEAFKISCTVAPLEVKEIDEFLTGSWKDSLKSAPSDPISVEKQEIERESVAAINAIGTDIFRPESPDLSPNSPRGRTSPTEVMPTVEVMPKSSQNPVQDESTAAVASKKPDLIDRLDLGRRFPAKEQFVTFLAKFIEINEGKNIFADLCRKILPMEGKDDQFIIPKGKTAEVLIPKVVLGINNSFVSANIAMSLFSEGDVKCTLRNNLPQNDTTDDCGRRVGVLDGRGIMFDGLQSSLKLGPANIKTPLESWSLGTYEDEEGNPDLAIYTTFGKQREISGYVYGTGLFVKSTVNQTLDATNTRGGACQTVAMNRDSIPASQWQIA